MSYSRRPPTWPFFMAFLVVVILGLILALIRPAHAQSPQVFKSIPIYSGTTQGTVAAGNDPRIITNPQTTVSPIFSGSQYGPKINLGPLNPSPLQYSDGGPLFIWNNSNPSQHPPGYNAGFRVWIGGNPTATPGNPDTVGGTMYIDSTNGRSNIWNMDLIAASSTNDEGGSDGTAVNIEAEMQSNRCFNPDPFGSANGCYSRTTGIGLTARGGGLYPNTVGFSVYSALGTGVDWWNTGLAMTRVLSTGILFTKNPSGSNGDAPSFTTAAIYDQSDSTRVLKIDGTHAIGIDLTSATSITSFIRGSNGTGTSIGINNASNFDVAWYVDSGGTAGQNSSLVFADRGTEKYRWQKDASNSFALAAAGQGYPIVVPVGTGHVSFQGGAKPTVSACGTGATILNGSSDTSGYISVGSGTVTSCTLVAATTYVAAPLAQGICTSTVQGVPASLYISAALPGSITLSSLSAVNLAGAYIAYHCF